MFHKIYKRAPVSESSFEKPAGIPEKWDPGP